VGKHFPGHGFARADSHVAAPADERALAELERSDLVPYACLIPLGLDGIMPAHVVYPQIDARPAGFSSRWLKEILRGRLGFHGLIFSDDLSMEGATVAGGIVERARSALNAGCDMALVCNDPAAAGRLLENLEAPPLSPQRAGRMRARACAASVREVALAVERLSSL
jgi:beta-N-acetylhexosaminidase